MQTSPCLTAVKESEPIGMTYVNNSPNTAKLLYFLSSWKLCLIHLKVNLSTHPNQICTEECRETNSLNVSRLCSLSGSEISHQLYSMEYNKRLYLLNFHQMEQMKNMLLFSFSGENMVRHVLFNAVISHTGSPSKHLKHDWSEARYDVSVKYTLDFKKYHFYKT